MKTSIKKLSMMTMLGFAMGANISCSEETLIQAISKYRSNDAIQQLIDAGADINAPDKQGSSPLMLAISTENKKIIDTLLKAGADVNSENDFGGNALLSAIFSDDEDTVRKLLAAGAKFNLASSIRAEDFARSYGLKGIVYRARMEQKNEAYRNSLKKD